MIYVHIFFFLIYDIYIFLFDNILNSFLLLLKFRRFNKKKKQLYINMISYDDNKKLKSTERLRKSNSFFGWSVK